jgi:hypothetical protein
MFNLKYIAQKRLSKRENRGAEGGLAMATRRISYFLSLPMSVLGPSRRFAAMQHFGRFWSEADIRRATLTEPDYE